MERSATEDAEGSGGAAGRKAKRMDWSEYLNGGEDEYGTGGCGAGSEDERETKMIVTELPDGLLKRAKLNTGAHNPGFPKGGNSNLYKPQFSDRCNAKSLLQNSMGQRYRSETEDDVGPRKVEMTGSGRECRWNSHITQEDDEFRSGTCGDACRSNLMNETGQFGGDLWEMATRDQAAEDNVHPDFV